MARTPTSNYVMVDRITTEKECIICLESLEKLNAQEADPEHPTAVLSCNHSFHDACLKFWLDRCSSCPLCRTDISLVKLVSSNGSEEMYPVTSKAQVADYGEFYDAENAMDEELWICPICNSAENEDLLLMCDGCESACYHTFCIGLGEVPEGEWFCPGCAGISNPTTASQPRSGQRRRRRLRQSYNHDGWSAAWSRVWDRLNSDLQEYQSELSDASISRREEELRIWTERIMANRRIASSSTDVPQYLDRDARPIEMRRAWSSFEKAKRSLENTSAHASLASETSTPKTPKTPKSPRQSRPLKRPSTKDKDHSDTKRQKVLPTSGSRIDATHFLQSINKTHICDNLDAHPLSDCKTVPIPDPPAECSSADLRSPQQQISPDSTSLVSSTTKATIQKAVREALHPHYRDGVISKGDFTEINKRVSRSLYAGQVLCDDTSNEDWRRKVEDSIQMEMKNLK